MLANLLEMPLLRWLIVSAIVLLGWYIVSLLCSHLSGWHLLVNRFKQEEDPASDTLDVHAGSHFITMGSLGYYPGLMRLSSAREALFLSVVFLCRPGHPPLRIPWSEVKLSEGETRLGWRMILTLGREERVRMRISARTARSLGLI